MKKKSQQMNKPKKAIHQYSISYLRKGDSNVYSIDYSGTESYNEVIKRWDLNAKDILWFNIIVLDNFQSGL